MGHHDQEKHDHEKHDHDKHGGKHHKHVGEGDSAAGSFGTNDTGKNEQKEWMDGLSDDE